MREARHREDPAWWAAFVELSRMLLPVACAGCGLEDVPLCDGCRAALVGPGRPVPALTHPGAPPTWCAATYAGTTRRAVVAWKDRGRHDLSPVLAAALARAVRALAPAPGAPLLLVPAPSSRRARRSRGGHLLAVVTARAAGSLRRQGIDARALDVLRQAPGVRDQAGLGAASRVANVAGSFRVAARAPRPGSRCVLVDDVVTTGSTLAEAARVLRGTGAVVLGAAVVAATPSGRSSP